MVKKIARWFWNFFWLQIMNQSFLNIWYKNLDILPAVYPWLFFGEPKKFFFFNFLDTLECREAKCYTYLKSDCWTNPPNVEVPWNRCETSKINYFFVKFKSFIVATIIPCRSLNDYRVFLHFLWRNLWVNQILLLLREVRL